VQPTLFLPGTNYVDYYFNGQRLTWTIKTNEGVSKKKVSEGCDYNSAPKCRNRDRKDVDINVKDGHIISQQPLESGKLYPNPANSTIWLVFDNYTDNKKTITIMSAVGVRFEVKIKSQQGTAMEIDISALPRGVYFIRIADKARFKTLSFIKL
jgi:hypothetical protein